MFRNQYFDCKIYNLAYRCTFHAPVCNKLQCRVGRLDKVCAEFYEKCCQPLSFLVKFSRNRNKASCYDVTEIPLLSRYTNWLWEMSQKLNFFYIVFWENGERCICAVFSPAFLPWSSATLLEAKNCAEVRNIVIF